MKKVKIIPIEKRYLSTNTQTPDSKHVSLIRSFSAPISPLLKVRTNQTDRLCRICHEPLDKLKSKIKNISFSDDFSEDLSCVSIFLY